MLESFQTIDCEIDFIIGEKTETRLFSKKTNLWFGWDQVKTKGRYIIVLNATHFVVMEKPEEIAKIVSTFIAKKLNLAMQSSL
mmetsp:Transcript_25247/g.30823  ORF Transcript_25247/g.30823 Transcript_25247/m.30823 type:complete len:83 (-) Transcript_25247:753-1001(-)